MLIHNQLFLFVITSILVIAGILPVEDDAEFSIPIRGEAGAPPLPPRDDLECDEAGGSPPPPLPPPLSSENLPLFPDNG